PTSCLSLTCTARQAYHASSPPTGASAVSIARGQTCTVAAPRRRQSAYANRAMPYVACSTSALETRFAWPATLHKLDRKHYTATTWLATPPPPHAGPADAADRWLPSARSTHFSPGQSPSHAAACPMWSGHI